MTVTIKEIAKMAGVSASTVSRILNQDPLLSVKKETREQVREIALKLNYRSTHKEKRRSYKPVAIITSMSEKRENEDPYWRNIHHGIRLASNKYGLSIAKVIRLGTDNIRKNDVSQYSSLILTGDLSAAAIQDIYRMNHNIVLVDARLHFNNIDSVEPDFVFTTEKLLNELASLGRKRIAFLGGINERMNFNGSSHHAWEDERTRVYRKWMEEHNYVEIISNGGWGSESGYENIKQLLSNHGPIDALITASDAIAIGAIKYLQEQNIKIGQDILVASFDNLDFVSYLNPPLTSVDLSPDAIGSTALQQALELTQGQRHWHKWTIIPGEIAYRASFDPKKLKSSLQL
ncbi:LacI family transcriptional regulator [Oenococcus sicerae]|uniref:LacI family transcriptional regulator n=1 Tax=Oenococcus sicerae TaxID=2203724 RepID=A0AAJ1R9Z2_9LACO|nr:LacI family DNA-binding transcriptional regulator [Oenococcus sicerae]MDN6899945.1 LacI family transcriptional regulator [Oenococcus sicerae]QAS69095.1 LacI family transcriptional regulator [Oenococcus sicerae]